MLELNGPTNKIIKKQQQQFTIRTIRKSASINVVCVKTKVYFLLTLMLKKMLMFQFPSST